MALPSVGADTGGDFNSRYGHSHEDGLRMPAVGQFVAFGQYASATPRQGDTIVDAERPLYTQKPVIEYDEQGRIKTFKPGTGPGYFMFGPMELQPAQFFGDNTNHSPRPGITLPRSISKAGLAVLSFVRNNTGHGDSPAGFIGLGVPHPTGSYVADGFVFELSGSAGARNLLLQATDYSGALDSSCAKKVVIQNALEVGCDLTVNGTVNELGTTEEITTYGAGSGSFPSVTCGDDAAIFEYEVIGWNDTDKEAIGAHGRIVTEQGGLLATLQEENTHAGSVSVSVSGGAVTIAVTNTRSANDNTCWTLKYRLTTRGAC